MALKGTTSTSSSLNVKTALDIQPAELKLSPAGKVTLRISGLKVGIPDVKLKLWFFPLMQISSIELSTDPMHLEVDLDQTSLNGKIERPTRLELQSDGELNVKADIEGTGVLKGGPLQAEV